MLFTRHTTTFAVIVLVSLACVSDEAVVSPTKGPSCAANQKVCLGRCVAIDDPLFGCAATRCDACQQAPYVDSILCSQGQCKVATCKVGRGDCEGILEDSGCETDLTRSASCGDCNTMCPADKPYCSFDVGAPACSKDCAGGLNACNGNVCANFQTSNSHCGGCNKACTPPTLGDAECKGGKCQISCLPGTTQEGDDCVADVMACLDGDALCKANAQCCSGLCQNGTCTTCMKLGASCSDKLPCCGTLECFGVNASSRMCRER
jgi:hypothetical protein